MPDVKFIRVPVTFDCKAKTARNGNISLYSEAGQLTYTYKRKETAREQPGTLSWLALNICEKEGKKLTGPPTFKP